jgi:hypothetical protein
MNDSVYVPLRDGIYRRLGFKPRLSAGAMDPLWQAGSVTWDGSEE